MKKFSRLSRIFLLLAVFFALDKGLGILRQLIIGRQFGLSEELDVFNAANNLPDMLFALISGGALAIAFIPVLSEVLTKEGQKAAWKLFSNVTNLAFLVTAGLSILVALLAAPLVAWELGIAPGFTSAQQELAVELMRLNLFATLIFSLSGLIMASLQANQHFLYPALAPILYDVGQIFGAVVLAPSEGYRLGGIQLPAFGLGMHGLVYGVIIGAALHLMIQIPGLIKHHFEWFAGINLRDAQVSKVIKLMVPRLLSMAAIQLIFLAQDNLASRLPTGSVTALTYGWLIMQVPETLIGTAIATALLPTLSEHVTLEAWEKLKGIISNAAQVMIALALPLTAILAMGLLPIIQLALGFELQDSLLVLWASQAFLLGLTGHSLVELGVRSFYARQNARIPLLGAYGTLILFITLGIALMQGLGAAGIALANSLAYSLQAVFLFLVMARGLPGKLSMSKSILRGLAAALIGGLAVWLIEKVVPLHVHSLILAVFGMAVGSILAALIVRRELRQLLQL